MGRSQRLPAWFLADDSQASRDQRPYRPQGWRRTMGVMFVRCFAELGYPFEAVKKTVLGHPRRWLDTVDGATDGKSFRCDVGPGAHWQESRKQVRVRLGKPTMGAAQVVIPMTWNPTGPGGLFPTLRGSVEIAALQPGLTLVSMMAEYNPPLGAIGRL